MTDKQQKKIYKAEVVKLERVCASSWYIEMKLPYQVDVEAGQFVSIYCDGLTLRRPFSVFTNDNGNIGVLFKERGKGTDYIKSLKIGDIVDLTGPFGNSFNIENKKSLLVGAGIGVAPVSYLKSKLDEKNIENMFIAGFLNKDEVPNCVKTDNIYTDDGSIGKKGSILTYLESIIQDYKPEVIYACGPHIVLKTIAEMGIKYNIETQVSMEKVMVCSIGVCRGCVIDVIKDGKIVNAAVCKEGPVFKGKEVVWQ